MTRKDYVAIAEAIALYGSDTEDVRAVAHAIASVMAADNPNFDRARFLDACGVRA